MEAEVSARRDATPDAEEKRIRAMLCSEIMIIRNKPFGAERIALLVQRVRNAINMAYRVVKPIDSTDYRLVSALAEAQSIARDTTLTQSERVDRVRSVLVPVLKKKQGETI